MNPVTCILNLIKVIPPVKWYRIRKYRRKFLTTRGWQGLHYGIFDSFDDARAALPATVVVGWIPDDDDWYITENKKIEIIDYPILFWLQRLIEGDSTLFDFGGHVGVTYRKYSSYLDYPSDFRWVVCELPVVAEYGQKLHDKMGEPHLSFVTDFIQAQTSSIFLAAGCIQYVEQPLATLLAGLATLPKHLILTKIPLYQKPTKVTLQNSGYFISPNWLFNRDVFISDICKLGYELIDTWSCPSRRNYIPFNSDYNIEEMSGLYFQKK